MPSSRKAAFAGGYLAGLESGLKTALVLSGVSTRADMERFPFRPDHVIERLADLGEILMKK
ncbi:HAD hydrolase-like protein [Mesorhizobium sp. M0601]|uniref:HAD hydrolase-like protein n=1 Tax=Mesorhizobium sp. M0601 TaxID=2956969 RepID=UPI003335587E